MASETKIQNRTLISLPKLDPGLELQFEYALDSRRDGWNEMLNVQNEYGLVILVAFSSNQLIFRCGNTVKGESLTGIHPWIRARITVKNTPSGKKECNITAGSVGITFLTHILHFSHPITINLASELKNIQSGKIKNVNAYGIFYSFPYLLIIYF